MHTYICSFSFIQLALADAKQENSSLVTERDTLKTQLTADKEAVQSQLNETVTKLSTELKSSKRELDETKQLQLLKQQVCTCLLLLSFSNIAVDVVRF